uniref:(northern house mosquito) hypothetical protein n=1 Tax=Culex pipiens TaxID=7175 RepID=A0A8D8HDB4_CULPI
MLPRVRKRNRVEHLKLTPAMKTRIMPHQQQQKKTRTRTQKYPSTTHIQDTHNTFHSSSKWNTIPERVLTDQRAADFLSKQFNITKLIARKLVFASLQEHDLLFSPPNSQQPPQNWTNRQA